MLSHLREFPTAVAASDPPDLRSLQVFEDSRMTLSCGWYAERVVFRVVDKRNGVGRHEEVRTCFGGSDVLHGVVGDPRVRWVRAPASRQRCWWRRHPPTRGRSGHHGVHRIRIERDALDGGDSGPFHRRTSSPRRESAAQDDDGRLTGLELPHERVRAAQISKTVLVSERVTFRQSLTAVGGANATSRSNLAPGVPS